MYEDVLRSVLKTAMARADSRPDARQPAFPQSISCLIHGEPLDLFVLEVRGTPSSRRAAATSRASEQAVAYLLVA